MLKSVYDMDSDCPILRNQCRLTPAPENSRFIRQIANRRSLTIGSIENALTILVTIVNIQAHRITDFFHAPRPRTV